MRRTKKDKIQEKANTQVLLTRVFYLRLSKQIQIRFRHAVARLRQGFLNPSFLVKVDHGPTTNGHSSTR